VVAVEQVGGDAALEELAFDRGGDGGLAGTRQPGEPDRGPRQTGAGPAVVAVDLARVPDDVGAGALGARHRDQPVGPRMMPPATVALVASSMRMKLPVSRLRR